MPVPTMRQILPKEAIRPLTMLGKYDWLTWRPIDSDPPSTSFQIRRPLDPALSGYWCIDRLLCAQSTEALMLFPFYIYSKALAGGPKLLRPTAEQCEALEHVDVNVAFEDYEQPFPVFIVEIPDELRRKLAERFNEDCPRFVLTLHDRPSKYVVCVCEHSPSKAGTFNIMSPRPCWATIEAALRFSVEQGRDFELAEVIQRIAINFGLLLTRFGVKDLGPLDPAAVEKQRRFARRQNQRKADRAKELLAASMNLIDFEQEVVFFDQLRSSDPNPDAVGPMKRPHWRRGHFRRQPCGQGRSECKLVFVRPCFINASHFQGDLADTSYTIRSAHPPDTVDNARS